MRWRTKRAGGRRRTPTSTDPVGAALRRAAAEGPLASRHPEVAPTLEGLADFVEVKDSDDVDGFDTVVWLDDEIASYCDAYDDGLDQALADQPGVKEVLAEDREVVYLRTSLALADVKAAVIRAIVEVNRRPRAPAPTAVLSDDAVDRLAAAVRPLLEQAGFVSRGPQAPRYSYREGEDGFVQSIGIARGMGTSGDGTSYDGLVWVLSGTYVPGFGREVPSSAAHVAPGHCASMAQHWTGPSPEALGRLLVGEVLPVLDATRSRDALAAWVSEHPNRVAVPMQRPTYARFFADWGLVDEAERVVAHLDEHWPSLRTHQDAVTARTLIREAREARGA